MRVQSLHVYPVKSFRAVDLAALEIQPRGPRGDREFMVVDDGGRFLTQRQLPAMSRLKAWTDGDAFHLDLGGRSMTADLSRATDSVEAQVWTEAVTARSVSSEIDMALSSLFGRAARLVRYDRSRPRLRTAPDGTSFEVAFPDSGPVLLASVTSLQDFNQQNDFAVPMDRFRANIVAEGLAPWAEERHARVKIGAIEFEILKPCTRCKMITIDQDRGEVVPPKALEVLAGRANSPHPGKAIFGVHMRPLGTGWIRAGDPVSWLE